MVRNLALLAGFCYTQFSDTYQEANGLLYADRRPKIPLTRVAEATAGATAARSDGLEQLHATLDERETKAEPLYRVEVSPRRAQDSAALAAFLMTSRPSTSRTTPLCIVPRSARI